MWKRYLISLLLFVAALTVSEFILYQRFMVPRLAQYSPNAPLWLHALVGSPLILLAFVVATWIRDLRSLFGFSLIAVVTAQMFGYLMATTRQPGHLKGYEDPFTFWTTDLLVGFLFTMLAFLIAKGFIILVRSMFKRKPCN